MVALGIIVLAVAATRGALAASQGGGSITACVHKKGGGLYRAKHCAKHDRALAWGTTGPRGVQGPTGAKGDPGAHGPQGDPGSASGFAYVKADGTVMTKGGQVDIAIDRIKPGEYCVIMDPNPGFFVPIVATIQGPDLTAALISVNTAFGSDCNGEGGHGVFTMNGNGTAADHDFVVALM